MAKASQPVPLAVSLKHLLSVVVDFLVNQNPQAFHKAPQAFTVAANLQPLVSSPKVGLVVEDYLVVLSFYMKFHITHLLCLTLNRS